MSRTISNFFSSSNERTNIIKHNVFFSALIRGVNILISLFLVPLTINYVSSELYGIWLSLSSIVTWFGFFDIGFGLGLRNRLTTALAFEQYKYGKILVSTTYAFMTIIFVAVVFLACICCTYIDWAHLLNISPDFNKTVTISFQIVIVAFCLRMVLQIVTNVCQAYQMTALASGIEMVGNVFSLFFMLVLVKTMAPSLVYLSAALCLAPFIAYLSANILLYRGRFKKVSPSLSYVRRFVIKDISILGAKFFLLQFISVILYQATSIIISHFCGPEQVTVYNVAYKYLNIALLLFSIIQSPIWSAYNDAFAKRDYQWMRNIYKKLVRLIILTEFFIVLLILVSPVVYQLWIGKQVLIPFHITGLLGIYVGILLIGQMQAMVLNGMGVIKLQTIMAIFQGVVYVPLVFILANSMKLEGIIIASILTPIPPVVAMSIQVPKLLNQTAKGLLKK